MDKFETDVEMTAAEIAKAIGTTPQTWNEWRRKAESQGKRYDRKRSGAKVYTKDERLEILAIGRDNDRSAQPEDPMQWQMPNEEDVEDRAYTQGSNALALPVQQAMIAFEKQRHQVKVQLAQHFAAGAITLLPEALELAGQIVGQYQPQANFGALLQPVRAVIGRSPYALAAMEIAVDNAFPPISLGGHQS